MSARADAKPAGPLELRAVKLAHRVAQAERRTGRGWDKLAQDAAILAYQLQERSKKRGRNGGK